MAPPRRFPILQWHHKSIHLPRVERLGEAIAQLAGPTHRMLDIGCGDGHLAKLIAKRLGSDVCGIDVNLRPEVEVEAKVYDGRKLPFADEEFDLVTITDVLHHADDPLAVVKEAIRVLRPTGSVIIKDHFRFGPWSNAVLMLMDFAGNYGRFHAVTGKYLSREQWNRLVSSAGGTADSIVWPFRLHDLPWRLVAKSKYQFLLRVRKQTQPSVSTQHT